MESEYIGIALDRNSSQVFTPQHWEMNLSEMGYFLVQWGWVLNIKPPPYIVDDESWQLMNKINKRKTLIFKELLPQEMPEELKELFNQLIENKS